MHRAPPLRTCTSSTRCMVASTKAKGAKYKRGISEVNLGRRSVGVGAGCFGPGRSIVGLRGGMDMCPDFVCVWGAWGPAVPAWRGYGLWWVHRVKQAGCTTGRRRPPLERVEETELRPVILMSAQVRNMDALDAGTVTWCSGRRRLQKTADR